MLAVLRYRVPVSRRCHYPLVSAGRTSRRWAIEARPLSSPVGQGDASVGDAAATAAAAAPKPLHRVCIVGSGPSGFYCAKYLLESKNVNVAVDIIEKLPVPFGTPLFLFIPLLPCAHVMTLFH